MTFCPTITNEYISNPASRTNVRLLYDITVQIFRPKSQLIIKICSGIYNFHVIKQGVFSWQSFPVTRDLPRTMFQILSILVLYLLACFTEQCRKFPAKCVSTPKGVLGWRLNSLGECLCDLQSRSCSNHAWKADTQELPSVCSWCCPQRPPGRPQRRSKGLAQPPATWASPTARPTSCFQKD